MVFSACVCQPVCPTSNNFWVLSNFNISEHSPEKQVHSTINSKESVQDTNLCFTRNWVLLIQLLRKPLVSSVTLNCFFSKLGRSVLHLNGFLHDFVLIQAGLFWWGTVRWWSWFSYRCASWGIWLCFYVEFVLLLLQIFLYDMSWNCGHLSDVSDCIILWLFWFLKVILDFL